MCEFGMHAGANMMFRPPFRVCYYDFNKRNREKWRSEEWRMVISEVSMGSVY